LLAGTAPNPGWRRKLGRPRCSWLCDVQKVTHLTAQEAWTAADDRKECRESIADYAFWWRCRCWCRPYMYMRDRIKI